MNSIRTLSELSALSGIKAGTLKSMVQKERLKAKKSGKFWVTSIYEVCVAIDCSNKRTVLLTQLKSDFIKEYYDKV